MFSGFMTNTWIVATIIAVIAGVVGFFVVLRGSAFPAHAIPNSAFAGAAAANVLGFNALLGLGVFAAASRGRDRHAGPARPPRRGHRPRAGHRCWRSGRCSSAAPASTSRSSTRSSSVRSSACRTTELLPVAALGVACIAAVVVLYRPLLLASVVPDIAEARGVRTHRMEMAFLARARRRHRPDRPRRRRPAHLLAHDRPARRRPILHRPAAARPCCLSVVIALVTVWAAIAISYQTNWPIGFFVGTISAFAYGLGRVWAAWRRTRTARTPAGLPLPAPSATAGPPPGPSPSRHLHPRGSRRCGSPPDHEPGRLGGARP